MELYLKISYLNDFIFCPLSIYYHQLYGSLDERMYYGKAQLDGKAVHSAVDEKRYSTHKNISSESEQVPFEQVPVTRP